MSTIYKLPTPTDSNQTIRVSMDDSTYSMRWLWNARDNHWAVTLSSADGTRIAANLRVVVGWDLLTDITSELAPAGALILFDESTSSQDAYGDDPGEDDLGDRVFLYYIPAAAVAELSV